MVQRFTPCLFLIMSLYGLHVRAAEPVRVAVMEFASKGGIGQDQVDALSDMLANEIRSLGHYTVIGKADVRSALQMHEQKSLLGCGDDTCVAEIGGALGVRWVVVGNVSLFGSTYLMNMKLMDVASVSVVSSVSDTIKGEQDMLLGLLRKSAETLFRGARKKLMTGGVEQPAVQPAKGEWKVRPSDLPPEKSEIQDKKPSPKRADNEPKPTASEPPAEPEEPSGEDPGPPKPEVQSADADKSQGSKSGDLVQPPSKGETEWRVVQPDPLLPEKKQAVPAPDQDPAEK